MFLFLDPIGTAHYLGTGENLMQDCVCVGVLFFLGNSFLGCNKAIVMMMRGVNRHCFTEEVEGEN